MSKHTLAQTIQKELQKINRQIDLKIINGESYRREARKHKTLLSQISQMNRRYSLGRTMGRSFSFMSLF